MRHALVAHPLAPSSAGRRIALGTALVLVVLAVAVNALAQKLAPAARAGRHRGRG
jgi:hypothetical protein